MKEKPPVYIVHLRRPNNRDENEKRSDPFWEYGSFGCTTCHRANLLSEKHASLLTGARLAFAQGGKNGFRLVYLTAPVTVHPIGSSFEVRWEPRDMPFRYGDAPLLVSNDQSSDVPALLDFVGIAKRSTPMGAFSSRFRSCATPLDKRIATQLVRVYEKARQLASRAMLAENYVDALPYSPRNPDTNRKKTLADLRAKRRSDAGARGC